MISEKMAQHIRKKTRGKKNEAKFFLICTLIKAGNKGLPISKLRVQAEKELGISSKNALYSHLRDLKKAGLITQGVGGRYMLPKKWNSYKYLLRLNKFFGIESWSLKEKFSFLKEVVYPHFSWDLLFLLKIYWKLCDRQRSIQKIKKLKPSPLRLEREIRFHGEDALSSCLAVTEFWGWNTMLAIMKDRIDKVSSLEELKKGIEDTNKKILGIYVGYLERISQDLDRLIMILENEQVKTPKIRYLGEYLVGVVHSLLLNYYGSYPWLGHQSAGFLMCMAEYLIEEDIRRMQVNDYQELRRQLNILRESINNTILKEIFQKSI